MAWDIFIGLLILYSVLVIPIQMGFPALATSGDTLSSLISTSPLILPPPPPVPTNTPHRTPIIPFSY